MRDAILSRLTSSPGVTPGRIASDRYSIVCGFEERTAHPLWVAKAGGDPGAIWRLRKEYEALTYLAPWAQELGIPRALEWREEGGESILIQSGMSGARGMVMLPVGASAAELRRWFDDPINWAGRFQAVVPPPQPGTISAVAERYAQVLEQATEFGGAMRGLIEILRDPASPEARSAPPVHGDFHSTNVLYVRPGLNVVDWTSFSTGFPLQDALSFLVNAIYYEPRRACTLLEKYRHAFFSKTPLCSIVRRVIESGSNTPTEARFLFYGFLATQICADADTPKEYWLEIVQYLDQHGYPAPGVELPAISVTTC